MSSSIIDAHIHLDMYEEVERKKLLEELKNHQVEGLIAVSNHLASAKSTLELARRDERIHPAFGYHPEQPLPSEKEMESLLAFLTSHATEMVAVGEVGLPYYLRKEKPGISLELYLKLLEQFIQLAAHYSKPVVLHAIYEDAPLVCDLLEKYSIKRAHFHWFKGDSATVRRIVRNGHMISVTPDCLYETEIQELIRLVPLSSLMVETDGPWPFEGPFRNQMTHPKMIHRSIKQIANIKNINVPKVYSQLYHNTKAFYLS